MALSQVIDNAAKYSPTGTTITIAARGAESAVEIIVSDQGAGITAEEPGVFRAVVIGSQNKQSARLCFQP